MGFGDVRRIIEEPIYAFPSNMQILFMCDASGNSDDVSLDEIRISVQ